MARGTIVKGAMIGGSFLPEKEFKKIIMEFFDKRENVIKIRSILNSIVEAPNPKVVYNKIEYLETELFKNPTVSFMLITNLDSPVGQYTWQTEATEKRLIDTNGAIKYTDLYKKNILNKEISSILSQHLLELINKVEQTKLSNEEIDAFFDENNIPREDKKEDGKNARRSRTLRDIVYGKSQNYKGQIADAFLNHLGNMHRSLFTQGFETISPFTQTVEQEEGRHFFQLLIDSKNHVGWQTGGDLILVHKNKVIANIQLKTLTKSIKESTNQTISTTDIQKLAGELRDRIEKNLVYDKETFAEYMWELVGKTSAIFDKVTEQSKKDAIKMVKEALNLQSS